MESLKNKPGSKYLGSNPIKNIIAYYAMQLACSVLDLYKVILEDSLCIKNSLQAISLLTDESASRFYGPDDKEPQYLSIRRPASLVRMSTLFKRKFVILQVCGKKTTAIKVFDPRAGAKVREESLSDVMMSSKEKFEPEETDYFCLQHEKLDSGEHQFSCYLIDDPSSICPGGTDICEGPFMTNAIMQPEQPCFLKKMASILGVELLDYKSNTNGHPLQKQWESMGLLTPNRSWSIFDVCSNSTLSWLLLGRKVVAITYHLGTLPTSAGTGSIRARLKPNRQTFRLISVIRDGTAERIDWSSAQVIGLTSSGRLYVMKDEYTEAVLTKRLKNAKDSLLNSDERLPRDAEKRAKEDKGKRKKSKEKVAKDLEENSKYSPCDCQCCLEGENWRNNLSPKGPQFLYKINPDVFHYLKLFNLSTEENRNILKSCQKLSCCVLDIEACTVNLQKGTRSDKGAAGDENDRENMFEPLSSAPRSAPEGDDMVALQRPLVLGHMDRLNDEIPKFFEVEGGISGVQTTVDKYLNNLVQVQEEITNVKREKLTPLFEFCDRYKEAHCSFFESKGEEEKKTDAIWKKLYSVYLEVNWIN